MASTRRALSQPYHDRPYQNGVNSPVSTGSPSHKLFSATATNSAKSPSSVLRRYLNEILLHKPKGFRRSLYRCLLFSLLGFLLGMFPFGRIDNTMPVPTRDLSFDLKPPHVNLRFDKNDGQRSDFAFNTVSLGVGLGADDVAREESVSRFDYLPRKQLIVVTPTYNRLLQAYYLNRLGQLLRLAPPPLLWIVVETTAASTQTAKLLRKTGVMYRHLVCGKNLTDVKDRGVHQRNLALEHIERHKLDGIVYFADDDNVYSLQLFESLRDISRFGTWPVAMLAQSKNKAILEGPVCNESKVIGWHTNEKSKRLRRFHVDMSGFAFNSTVLWDPKRWQRPFSTPIRQLDTVKEGFQETTFIGQIVEDESQMEGVPAGCSRILNWHLHLDSHGFVYPRDWVLQKNLDVVLPVQ